MHLPEPEILQGRNGTEPGASLPANYKASHEKETAVPGEIKRFCHKMVVRHILYPELGLTHPAFFPYI